MAAVQRTFDVLIVGGGNAGVSAAARLIRRGVTDVAIIEPQGVHTYRPLLSYVGGGEASLRDAERTQRSVIPRGATWIREPATAVDPAARAVTCADGTSYGYRDVVVATGLVPDTDELPDLSAALRSPAVASNYVDLAEKTWELVKALPAGGHAVFTVPRPPVSCTGTTIKPLFLAAAHWRRTGILPAVRMSLIVDRPDLLGVAALDDRLRRHLDELGVELRHGRVTGVHPDRRAVTWIGPDGTSQTVDYDMLHLVPPFRGPRWLAESGLTADGSHGLVDVDPRTFRHRSHAGVWAIGDCATVDTDPSGGALRRQTAILADNILAVRRGGGFSEYDGYTVAPIATDAHRLIFGEFDRRGELSSSLPSFVDPLKAYRATWAVDRYALPPMYWHLILPGRA
ncbi:NAD(P)/FAD-dependent oxidoreductase [Mycobacterium sp. MYCO198283]|uniref:NAD(P)/FAD-dependent oxidoreductase n=1 Tax=Mycobacterium sp. MYCO198283 TaxID=2883505 RepID=UPI001E65CC6D|nr:FAD/NAD(P)-binding oxidoreductase [Mycobacterium sp. MYCO198283]MCG5431933.1 NAD(P)/FAD-dependent oxidoreductase [Mycobacterium sp. MYCO198283]